MSSTNSGAGLMAYVAAGPEILCYRVDRETGAIALQGAITLPSNVQYAVADSTSSHLYVATSDRGQSTSPHGTVHRLVALAIDRQRGTLREHGPHLELPYRPIHITIDPQDRNVLSAFSYPAGLRAYRIAADGTIASEVAPMAPLDIGIYPHQVRMVPGTDRVALVARGNDATAAKPEEPGAIKVFRYADGRLANDHSVAPGGGFGFGPRHLDFHPSQPWVYVSLERQNQLSMFALQGSMLSPSASFTRDALAEPQRMQHRQLAGAIRVHPSGTHVFIVNRADDTVEAAGKRVFAGGENNIAVFRIDPMTGEPTPLVHVDTNGIHCRNLQFDPSGEILAASHIDAYNVRKGDAIAPVPPRLSLFRVGADGYPRLMRSHDIPAEGRLVFWMGLVRL